MKTKCKSGNICYINQKYKCHRVGMYSIFRNNQSKVWNFNGLVHRVNGYAIVYTNEYKYVLKNSDNYDFRKQPDYGYWPDKYRLYDMALRINIKKLVI